MAAITLDIAGNTRQLDRDIQKTVNKVYSINLKTKGDQPLGRITGKVDEFTKSLDASNARVIAFGASAGIIYGVERAFTALVSTTIEVQKSLQDINVILNVSQAELQKFGDSLFSIARNTGQSFKEVASAATEFSRQGLGVEETLKRTSEALILSRLSGLDTAKSVETLTAAVNSFASQAVTATEIVNKFATVDAAFAVSSADLADAISRVGSSAAQSGVSLNELIAIVTSAQQTTARGGAVIGNSFKTIFTRLQREKVVDLLESLGISSTDSSGQLKSTIQLLTDLGKVYDTLGSQQQAYVAEQVGGVFQINILKAALADLGKEYSIYGNALNVAAGATDQAIRRNEELNKTYAAQINALQENARQLAAAGGERLLGPSIDRLVGGTNTLLKGFNESDGQNFGATLGKGIVDGLGQFIAGPGLALIGGVLIKLFRDLTKFATGSVQQLLGLNNATTQQQALQSSIQQILTKNPQLLELALKGQQGLNTAANTLLASLQKQTVELQKQAQVAAQISKAFVAQAGVRVSGGIPVTPIPTKSGKVGKAAGYIPNFASDKVVEKYTAIALGASPNVRPHMSKGTIGGKKFVMNNQEIEFPGVGENGDSMVIPKYGDGPSIAAAGFIPNFAEPDLKKFRGNKPGEFDLSQVSQKNLSRTINFQNKYGYLLPPGFGSGALSGTPKYNIPPGIRFSSPDPSKIKKFSDPQEEAEVQDLQGLIVKNVSEQVARFTNVLAPEPGRVVNPKEVEAELLKTSTKGAFGALRSITGAGFEIGITKALDYQAATREKGGDFDVRGGKALGKVQELFGITAPLMDFKVSLSRSNTDSFYEKIRKEEKLYEAGKADIDKDEINKNARALALTQMKDEYPKLYQKEGFQPKVNLPAEDRSFIAKELNKKIEENKNRFINLGLPDRLKESRGSRIRAAGYIPNFVNDQINDAVNREVSAGIPKNQIYLAQEDALKKANPDGLGIFNKLQEPNKKTRKEAMRRKGFAKGYIPNFAIEDPDVQAADLGSSIGAVVTQLGFLAIGLRGSGEDYKNSLKELTKTNVSNAKVNLQNIREQAKANIDYSSLSAFKESRKQAANQIKSGRAEVKAAQSGTAGQKLSAGLGAGGLALSFGAPIIAETIKNAIGQETSGARKAGAAVSTVGQIASFAGTGAMFGPWGAAIGAATGALLTVPSLLDEMTATAPEFAAAAKKASQDLTKFNDAGQQVLTSSAELSKLLKEGASGNKLKKAQEAYNQSLSVLSSVDRGRLATAAKLGSLEEEYAKILAEKVSKERSTQSEAALSTVYDDINDVGSRFLQEDWFAIGSMLGKTGSALSPTNEDSAKRRSAIAETFTTELKGAKSPEEFLKSLRDIEIPKEVTNKQQLDNFIDGLQELPVNFRNILKQIGSEDPAAVFQLLRAQIIYLRKDTADFIKDGAALQAAENERQAILKQEQMAIDQTISSIQKNIAIQNLWRSSLENLNENLRGFFSNLKIEQELTQPKNILQDLIGSDADPSRKLAIKEGVATINESQRTGNATSGINFKQNVRGILEKPFQENLDKIIGDLNAQQLDGTDKDIKAASENIQNKSLEQFGLLNQTMKTVEGLMSEFVAGQISTEQLLEQSKAALSGVGIDVSRGTQASNDIEKAVAELEISTIQEQVKAFQQRVKLANETKQAILQSKINQALGVFGGFEGFLGRTDEKGPDTPETYIERIDPELKKIEKIRSSPEFRYNNPESVEERSKKTPELGRNFAKVYGELITQSGGAFREFIQETLKQRQITQGGAINYRLRDGQDYTGSGAVGQLGGYDDIVKGLQQDIENQLKLAEDKIKTTSDPVLKRDLQGFVDSIRKLPGGTEGIAQLQASKGLGVARQSDFEKVYNKYDNASLEKLKELSPELASSLAEAVTFGDPLLAETQVQSGIQTKILDVINKAVTESGIDTGLIPEEMKQMLETGTTATTPGTGTTASTTTSSQTYPGTPFNGPLTYPNAKAIPGPLTYPGGKSTPKPLTYPDGKSISTKSISQIEAETTEARDRARSMGMSLNEYREKYSKGAPQIGSQPSPDFQKYQELNKPRPEGFKSQDDMLLNFLQRLNFKETGKILSPEQLGFNNKESQKLPTQQKSFTQEDAALNSNTAAINSLTENLKNLGNKLTEEKPAEGNNNQTPGRAAAITGAQPNVTTTTNAPVNVVVNAQTPNDVATQVGLAVQNAIPQIIEKVKIAMGQKVPPTIPNQIPREARGS